MWIQYIISLIVLQSRDFIYKNKQSTLWIFNRLDFDGPAVAETFGYFQ